MPLRKMRACLAAAGRRECRRKADFLHLMALAAQGDEKGIRDTLATLRRGAHPHQQSAPEEARLIILTDG